MLTFKQFIVEARDHSETIKNLRAKANSTSHEGEKTSYHAKADELEKKHSSEHKPEHKKEPLSLKQSQVIEKGEKENIKAPEKEIADWQRTHMHLKPSGERRYTSERSGSHGKQYKTHNRSESEVHYHESQQAAHKHLHGQGYTQTIQGREYSKDSQVEAGISNTARKAINTAKGNRTGGGGDSDERQKYFQDKKVGRRKSYHWDPVAKAKIPVKPMHPNEKFVRDWPKTKEGMHHDYVEHRDAKKSKTAAGETKVSHTDIKSNKKGREERLIDKKTQVYNRLKASHFKGKSHSDLTRDAMKKEKKE